MRFDYEIYIYEYIYYIGHVITFRFGFLAFGFFVCCAIILAGIKSVSNTIVISRTVCE